jgi:hypothetical protein
VCDAQIYKFIPIYTKFSTICPALAANFSNFHTIDSKVPPDPPRCDGIAAASSRLSSRPSGSSSGGGSVAAAAAAARMQNEMMPAQKFWAGLVQPGEALVVSPEDYSVTVTFASFDAASDRKDRAVLRVQFDDDDVQQVMPPSPRHLGTSSRHHVITSAPHHASTSAPQQLITSAPHHPTMP